MRSANSSEVQPGTRGLLAILAQARGMEVLVSVSIVAVDWGAAEAVCEKRRARASDDSESSFIVRMCERVDLRGVEPDSSGLL